MKENFVGGELVSEVFKREGVKYIFGLPGGHIYPMVEGCEDRGIKYIGVRNEQTASFMAEGWALTTGDFGVCTATAGPGFTNLVTGLANSDRGCVPVLCMAGKARTTEYDRNELQDFNQIDMIKHMTKHARSVLEPNRIPEYVGRAIAQCTTGTPGPVYLEIPRNLMETKVPADQVSFQQTYRTQSRAAACPADIEAAAKLLRNAQKPVIVAGGGVWWSQAQNELTALVEKLDAPVFTRNAARGCVQEVNNPLFGGIAASGSPVFRNLLAQADVCLIIGTRPGYTMKAEAFPPHLKIIRVDVNAAEINNHMEVEVGLVGDAKAILQQLIDAVEKASHPEWVNAMNGIKMQMMQMLMPLLMSNQTPIHPLRLMAELYQRIDEDTIIVIDGGDTATWGNIALPARMPGGYLTIASTSFGPLGVGIPYAMAAKLAHPDKKVILLTGDGTFGYGAMEYDTALHYGINFTTVILNDKTWGMIKRSEAKKAGADKEFIGLDLSERRYDKVVEALGGHGEFVTEPQDIGAAIDRAIASGKPSCVNVMTDSNIGPMF